MTELTSAEKWQHVVDYLIETRYSILDPETGLPTEHSYEEMINRIGKKLKQEWTKNIFNEDNIGLADDIISALLNRYIVIATPGMMAFGNEYTKRSGCFSCYPMGQPEDDSMKSIQKLLEELRIIYMHGGGAGVDLSNLRPKGSPVDNKQGTSSGPVGFLTDFNAVTETTNQGGRRRAALLVQLDWDHKDIIDFVTCKNGNSRIAQFIRTLPVEDRHLFEHAQYLTNMNLSVNVFGDFYKNKKLIDLIAKNMWETGDPGLLFVDNSRKNSPLREDLGHVARFSNPCGEYLSADGTCCNLLSVNSALIAMECYDEETNIFNFDLFYTMISKCAYLACILGNFFINYKEGYPPVEGMYEKNMEVRPVGVGMSGFHTALLLSDPNTVYGDEYSCKFAEKLQASLTLGTLIASKECAELTGLHYENKKFWTNHVLLLSGTLGEIYEETGNYEFCTKIKDLAEYVKKHNGFYNAVTTSQAPTGSTSIFLYNMDTGIEPYFSIEQTRKIKDKSGEWKVFSIEPYYLEKKLKNPEFRKRLESQLANNLRNYEEQLNLLGSFQKFIHTGISKTVNLPESITVDEIKKIIMIARDKNLKGLTVYRDGSLDQVIKNEKTEEKKKAIEHNGNEHHAIVYKAKSASLTSYITLSYDDENQIREVFCQSGDCGSQINSIYSAFGIVISTALKHHPELATNFIKSLSKVRGDERYTVKTTYGSRPIVGDSIPNVIGQLIDKTQKYLAENKVKNSANQISEDSHDDGPVGNFDLCPECRKLTLKRKSGCFQCVNTECNYSGC